ncbi:MAG TPA: hypothetical protein PLB70_03425 [Paludibacteraceae bacterium]|nr:hypothetical protein [Paludibacteraceae bacterium]
MRITEDVVKTSAGDVWKYQIDLPDSIEEAIELFGADGSLALLSSGLKVKKQAIARELFKAGKTLEEVNEAVAAYRPGSGSKKSQAEHALELITAKADHLNLNPDIKSKVIKLASKKDFKAVIDLLKDIE